MRAELIYRVEDGNHTGMYQGAASVCSRLPDDEGNKDYYSPRSRHPAPSMDRKLGPIWKYMGYEGTKKYIFGFSSMEQLRHWLCDADVCEELKARGFAISIYNARHYHIGDTQAIFLREEADFVGALPLI